MVNKVRKLLSLMALGMIEVNKYISNGGSEGLKVTL